MGSGCPVALLGSVTPKGTRSDARPEVTVTETRTAHSPSSAQAAPTYERGAERAHVSVPARWTHHQKVEQPGEVRDISTVGMFLRPAGGTVRFRLQDVVRGTIRIGPSTRVFTAHVRWRGWSLEHRCVGLGLEFTPDCALDDEELRAIRWPQDDRGRARLTLVRGADEPSSLV